jgi:hypothetical protein
MKENEILEEKIDQYLKGSMTNQEREAFESQIEKDSELRREVELQRSIIWAVRKEQLEKIIQNEEEKISKKTSIRKLVIYFGSIAVAASLSGVFYIGYLNDCESISNRYYQSYTYTPIPTRGDQVTALTHSDSIFFEALHHLENGQKKLAITQLESLNNSSAEMLAATNDVVKWYLSLAYLKNGQKKRAKTLLLEIANSANSEYKTKAEDLLKEL